LDYHMYIVFLGPYLATTLLYSHVKVTQTLLLQITKTLIVKPCHTDTEHCPRTEWIAEQFCSSLTQSKRLALALQSHKEADK
jgi:hypothetical protein